MSCGRLELPSGAAELTGQVIERNGTGVANARVMLIDGQTKTHEVRTDASGHFAMSGLPVGPHAVLVLAGGERGTWREGIDVRGGGVTSLDAVELEPVWAFLDVLWLRDVGFDEQWTHGTDGLDFVAEGVSRGTIIATRTTLAGYEMVEVGRDGTLTTLLSTPHRGEVDPDTDYFYAFVRRDRAFFRNSRDSFQLYDLREHRILATLPIDAILLPTGEAFIAGPQFLFINRDGTQVPLPLLNGGAALVSAFAQTGLVRAADGRIAQLNSGTVQFGDVVPTNITWTAATGGFIGWESSSRSMLWLDANLSLHQLAQFDSSSSAQGVARCGSHAAAGVAVTSSGGQSIATLREGAPVITNLSPAAGQSEFCLADDRLVRVVRLPGGKKTMIASVQLDGKLVESELPLGAQARGVHTDGRVFVWSQASPSGASLALLEPGQPLEHAQRVGSVPFLFSPVAPLRDGSVLCSGSDLLGGYALFRIEVAS